MTTYVGDITPLLGNFISLSNKEMDTMLFPQFFVTIIYFFLGGLFCGTLLGKKGWLGALISFILTIFLRILYYIEMGLSKVIIHGNEKYVWQFSLGSEEVILLFLVMAVSIYGGYISERILYKKYSIRKMVFYLGISATVLSVSLLFWIWLSFYFISFFPPSLLTYSCFVLPFLISGVFLGFCNNTNTKYLAYSITIFVIFCNIHPAVAKVGAGFEERVFGIFLSILSLIVGSFIGYYYLSKKFGFEKMLKIEENIIG